MVVRRHSDPAYSFGVSSNRISILGVPFGKSTFSEAVCIAVENAQKPSACWRSGASHILSLIIKRS